MRAPRFVLLSFATLILLLPVQAMKNDDLIKMKEAGLSEDTIVYAMGVHPAEYDASPDALIALKKAGLSEIVILKLISLQKRPAASESPPEQPAPSPAAAPAPQPAPAREPPGIATATPPPASPPPPAAARAEQPTAPPARALRSSATDASGATEPTASAASMPAPAVAEPAGEKAPSEIPPLAYPSVGADFYTRYSFHYERGRHLTTNYARGSLVPINTRVKLVSMTDDELVLQRLDSGDRVRVKNVEKHSRKPTAEVARLLLSAEKMPVDQQPVDIAVAIQHGELCEGMTKEQAIMARGYPPEHRTPSIDADKWVYWSSRFIRHTITFKDGRLLDGRGVEERDPDQ